MKKPLYVLLILFVSLTVNADMVLSGPTQVISGEPFQLIISGLSSDIPQVPGGLLDGGVYGDTVGHGHWFDHQWNPAFWFEAVSGFSTPAAGNLADVYDIDHYGGWEFFVVGDSQAGGVQDGDWIAFNYVAGEAGTTAYFDLYDLSSDLVLMHQIQVDFIPEPLTLCLLAVGGLLIRKR